MKKSKKSIHFDAAYQELIEITDKLQSGETGIEELADNVKRASELITFCKEKLKNVKHDIEGVLNGEDEK